MKPIHAVTVTGVALLQRVGENGMKMSMSKGMAALRAAALAFLLGSFLSGPVPVMGQQAEPVVRAQVVDPVVEEEDEGFDDWGLLGLLGLAGLAGLMKREREPVVHTPVDRDRTTI